MRVSLWFLLAVTFGIVLTFLAVVFRPGAESTALWFLGLLASFPIWRGLARRLKSWLTQCDLFSPLFGIPLAYIVWFGIGSIDFLDLPHSLSSGAFDPIPCRTLFYAGIGLVGYICGAKLGLSGYKGPLPEKFPHFQNIWKRRVTAVLTALALITVGTYLYIVWHVGITILRPDAAEARLLMVNYHLTATVYILTAYTLFLFLVALWWSGPPLTNLAMRLAVFIGAVAFVVFFLSLSSRAGFFIVVLTSCILYNYLKKPLRLGRVLLFAAGLFAVLSLYGYVRDLTVKSSMSDWLVDAGVPRQAQPFLYCYLYIRYPVATFRDVTEVIPSQVPYQLGAITLMPAKSVLPGHHEMSDFYFKNLLGNEFLGAGQPATLLAPFYADFGPVGIFLGMLGYGALLASLYRWMMKEPTLLSALVFAWTTQVGLFGLFGAIFADLGSIVILIGWAVLDFLMRRAPRTRASSGPLRAGQLGSPGLKGVA